MWAVTSLVKTTSQTQHGIIRSPLQCEIIAKPFVNVYGDALTTQQEEQISHTQLRPMLLLTSLNLTYSQDSTCRRNQD